MWSMNITVILRKKKGDLEIAETVQSEITKILEHHLETGDLDDYAVEIEF